ncbi:MULTISPECIES: hypothetical protein [Aureimonas]|nr:MULTISPECIES: hypothetical protein [Aureimonas]MBB3934625.1 hypothetical protein [Aureimonas phyllosphaerae]MBB3950564.1 hypothetical protein [Aureimonas jatrophae]MBB3958159.1 hypothetical protein [Aureimonas phyllosphaerae]
MSKQHGPEDTDELEMEELAQIEDGPSSARDVSKARDSGLSWVLIAGALLAVCVVLWSTLG